MKVAFQIHFSHRTLHTEEMEYQTTESLKMSYE
jgi:hypothetical protein